MKSVYIATAWDNYAEQRVYAKAFAEAGWRLTFDWTTHRDAVDAGEVVTAEYAKRAALDDMCGVLEADLLVVLLPGGHGTHVEIGMALAAKKSVLIVLHDAISPATACPFYFLPGVHHYRRAPGNMDDAARVISVGAKLVRHAA